MAATDDGASLHPSAVRRRRPRPRRLLPRSPAPPLPLSLALLLLLRPADAQLAVRGLPPSCAGLCADGRKSCSASVAAACERLRDGAVRAVGQFQLEGGLGPAWTRSSVPLVAMGHHLAECEQHYRSSLSGTGAPSACSACSDDGDGAALAAAVAGRAVLVDLHGCLVQDKARRLGAAGAVAVLTMARREAELLGLYARNSKVYRAPAGGGAVDGAAPTVMVEQSVGKALLALLTPAGGGGGGSDASLTLNVTAEANEWDALYSGSGGSSRWAVLCWCMLPMWSVLCALAVLNLHQHVQAHGVSVASDRMLQVGRILAPTRTLNRMLQLDEPPHPIPAPPPTLAPQPEPEP